MLLIINHKANLTYKEIISYEKKLRKLDLIVLPTECYLPLFQKGKYKLGSQDISEFKDTNRTGEVNGEQLKHLNVKYCLVGHIDRRIYNNENNNILIEKLKRCYENNIIPLYCIGEENYDNYKEELKKQIDIFYKNYNNKDHIIVYEPQKNIGNSNADLSTIEETINYIKEYIKTKYQKDPTIVYGGGVRRHNIEYIKQIKNIEGLILSAKTLNINELMDIYKETKK